MLSGIYGDGFKEQLQGLERYGVTYAWSLSSVHVISSYSDTEFGSCCVI